MIRTIWEWVKILAMLAAIFGVIFCFGCVKWNIYHARFPNAPFWTMFF